MDQERARAMSYSNFTPIVPPFPSGHPSGSLTAEHTQTQRRENFSVTYRG
jgi:hypothetical protein